VSHGSRSPPEPPIYEPGISSIVYSSERSSWRIGVLYYARLTIELLRLTPGVDSQTYRHAGACYFVFILHDASVARAQWPRHGLPVPLCWVTPSLVTSMPEGVLYVSDALRHSNAHMFMFLSVHVQEASRWGPGGVRYRVQKVDLERSWPVSSDTKANPPNSYRPRRSISIYTLLSCKLRSAVPTSIGELPRTTASGVRRLRHAESSEYATRSTRLTHTHRCTIII